MLTVSHPPGHNSPLSTSRPPAPDCQLITPPADTPTGVARCCTYVCLPLIPTHGMACGTVWLQPPGEACARRGDKTSDSPKPFIAGGARALLLLAEEKLLLLIITRYDATFSVYTSRATPVSESESDFFINPRENSVCITAPFNHPNSIHSVNKIRNMQ